MGYSLEFNCLLRVPSSELDLETIKVGGHYHIIKDGERLYPLSTAIEICDDGYVYYGKVAVRKLTLETGRTSLEIEVLRIFDKDESDAYTRTFTKA